MSDMNRAYEQKVNHIKCKVKSCRYHDTSDCCTAQCIEVAGCGTSSCEEAACTTFEELR